MLKEAVLYCRVSSKEQEKEGYSIPAQQKLLREYASKNSIKIVREYADAETAKSSGREQFCDMLNYLEASKEVNIVLAEKTDRLYRNFRDYVTVDDLDLEIHLVKEGEILSKDSKSHQKFIHGIKVLMAKNYIDNLSEEVKKGLYEKAERGEYPGQAPTGYKNIVTKEKRHVISIDKERAPFIKRMFEMYATGEYSLDDMHEWAGKSGLVSKYNKPLSRANIERILKNPVYYGDFFYAGKLYNNGVHQPIVSKELWDLTQMAFKKRYNTQQTKQHDFTFSGLMKCADCGCSVVAEKKKQKYIYYHCSRFKKQCTLRNTYVREEKLLEQFESIFKLFNMPKNRVGEIVKVLKDSHADKNRYRNAETASLRRKIDTLRSRVERIYLDKLDGKIDEDFWHTQSSKWQSEIKACERRLESLSNADEAYYENGQKILELARNAHRLFLRATNDEKRKLLNMILSNCTLNGATIEYQIRNPFHLMAKWVSRPAMLPFLDSSDIAWV